MRSHCQDTSPSGRQRSERIKGHERHARGGVETTAFLVQDRSVGQFEDDAAELTSVSEDWPPAKAVGSTR